jgi:GT2 family glycosyltransferase
MADASADRSNGFLPLAPLAHPEPTGIGVLDLAALDTIFRPVPPGSEPRRDQILLVRLHGQSLGIIDVPAAELPGAAPELVREAWQRCGPQIASHAERCRCIPVPASAEQLIDGLAAVAGTCPESIPVRPVGQATVIVATVGRLDVLERCLDALSDLTCDDFEVLVVDNRPSTSNVRAVVERYQSRCSMRYVAEPRPGLAIARNTGLASTSAAFVAFTDDDVVVDKQWLAWLLAPFADDAVSSVTGLVMPLSLDSPVQKRFEQYCGFGKGTAEEVYDLIEHRADDRLLYPYWGGMFGSGNSMAFRSRALAEFGGFDPALGAGTPTGGGEDIAAFTDVILSGGRIVYEPRSVCWHEHRGDEAGLEKQIHSYGVGLTAVFWKYLWRDPRFALTALRSVPLVLRLVSSRREERSEEQLPDDLSKLEARGRLLGPWRYMESQWRLRRK